MSSMSFEQGPYLEAALLCEKVLVEQDGVKSAIRIVDRVTHTETIVVTGVSPPEKMEPFDYELTLLVKLKAGRARGPYTFRVPLDKPSGERSSPFQQTINFEGEDDRGVDIIGNIRLRIDMAGLYWFHVYLKDERLGNEVHLTQIPLRVIYLRKVMQMPGAGEGPPPAPQSPAGS